MVATLPAAEELERLRADHAAIPRLRSEIEALRTRAQTAVEKAKLSERFEAGSKVPYGVWRNAGTATSKATLETVFGPLQAVTSTSSPDACCCLKAGSGNGRSRCWEICPLRFAANTARRSGSSRFSRSGTCRWGSPKSPDGMKVRRLHRPLKCRCSCPLRTDN